MTVDGQSESSQTPPRVQHTSTPGEGSGQVGESNRVIPRTDETKNQKKAYLQVGRYLLEQFSVPAFRSHATIGLVDRHRIQFIHANHSVILVSSAIDFSSTRGEGGEDGLDKFIAVVIAFNRLSLCESGIILHGPSEEGPFKDNGRLPRSPPTRDPVNVQSGKGLKFGADGENEPFTLKFGAVISHEPSLAGRGTAVLRAKCSSWKGLDLVIKIGWPGSRRAAEHKFIEKATEKAKSNEIHAWALNHLPKIFYARDVAFGLNSTHERVARLFDKAKFVDKGYEYERRTMRIIVQERLYPLKDLTNVKDIAQVLLDVACSGCF